MLIIIPGVRVDDLAQFLYTITGTAREHDHV
jgi:hypothetical protein